MSFFFVDKILNFFLPWSKKLPLCPVWCYFSEYYRSCGHIGEVEQKPRYLPLLWPLEGLELLPVIRGRKSEQKKYASLVARRRRADQTYKNQTHIWKFIVHIKHTEINLTYCLYQTYRNQSTNHIFREFDAWQVLDIFMLSVDDLRQLPAVNHLLVHVHLNFCVEFFLPFHHIFTKNFGNRRTPDKKKNSLLQNVFNLTFDGKYLLNFSLKHVFNRKQ